MLCSVPEKCFSRYVVLFDLQKGFDLYKVETFSICMVRTFVTVYSLVVNHIVFIISIIIITIMIIIIFIKTLPTILIPIVIIIIIRAWNVPELKI